MPTLPVGRYPLVSLTYIRVIFFLTWLFSAGLSVLVNQFFPVAYEPAVSLCIPSLPSGFFISALTTFSLILGLLVLGFIGTIIYLRKAQARVRDAQDSGLAAPRKNYQALERSLCSNFFRTIFHIM